MPLMLSLCGRVNSRVGAAEGSLGQSSKTQLVSGQLPEDYIGRFGIGLLSCFMISDSITVSTVPVDKSQANVWTGFVDGTYTLEPFAIDAVGEDAGTTVILKAKKGEEHYFQEEKIEIGRAHV